MNGREILKFSQKTLKNLFQMIKKYTTLKLNISEIAKIWGGQVYEIFKDAHNLHKIFFVI